MRQLRHSVFMKILAFVMVGMLGVLGSSMGFADDSCPALAGNWKCARPADSLISDSYEISQSTDANGLTTYVFEGESFVANGVKVRNGNDDFYRFTSFTCSVVDDQKRLEIASDYNVGTSTSDVYSIDAQGRMHVVATADYQGDKPLEGICTRQ
jgi:hypothetical protein